MAVLPALPNYPRESYLLTNATSQDCVLGGGTFVGPDGCCVDTPPVALTGGAPITIDVSHFTPPFSLRAE